MFEDAQTLVKEVESKLRWVQRSGGVPPALEIEEFLFEITYRCNEQCVMCNLWQRYQRYPGEIEKELKAEELMRMFERSKCFHRLRRMIFSGGEAFLRPDLVELCGYLASAYPGLSLGVLSNLYDSKLILKQVGRILESKPHDFWIGGSLDGFGDIHDQIRRRQGAFRGLERTIDMLKKEFPQVRVHINCTVRPENSSDLEKLYDYATARGMSLSMQFQAPWRAWEEAEFLKVQKSVWNIMSKTLESYRRGAGDGNDQTRHWQRRQVLKDLYRWKGMLDYQKRPARYLRYCVAGIQRVEMSPTGNVFFCPFSKDFPVGNIRDFDYDFDALWTSAAAAKAREKVWDGKCHCWLNCAVYPNVNLALETCEQKHWKSRAVRYLKSAAEIRIFRLSVWQMVLFSVWLFLLPLVAVWGMLILCESLAAAIFAGKKKPVAVTPGPEGTPVSIVIANYNGRELLAECLPDTIMCMKREAPPESEILVADDASQDESVAFLRQNFPEVRVISLAENQGYASATAAGVKESRNRFVFLLNSDVRLKAGCVSALLCWFRDPGVFAVQPKMFAWDGQTVNGGCNFRREDRYGYFGLENESDRVSEKPVSAPRPTPYAIGGAMLLDKVKWDLLGGFDPLFAPFCWEDVDLCYRARRRGWRVIYEPRGEVFHRHHATLSKFYRPEYKMRIEQRNEMIFTWKNLLGLGATLRHVLLFPRHVWWRFFERNEAGFGRAFLAALAEFIPVLLARWKEHGYAADPFREDFNEQGGAIQEEDLPAEISAEPAKTGTEVGTSDIVFDSSTRAAYNRPEM